MRFSPCTPFFSIVLSVLLGGCGDAERPVANAGAVDRGVAEVPVAQAAPKRPAAAERRRTDAPVEVKAARVGATSASLRFHFQAAAEAVDIQIYGTDGVRVASEAHVEHHDSLEAGERLSIDVRYTTESPKEPRGNLAVLVQGVFAGRPAVRVVSFSIGDPRPRGDGSERHATAPGENIHSLPATEKVRGK